MKCFGPLPLGIHSWLLQVREQDQQVCPQVKALPGDDATPEVIILNYTLHQVSSCTMVCTGSIPTHFSLYPYPISYMVVTIYIQYPILYGWSLIQVEWASAESKGRLYRKSKLVIHDLNRGKIYRSNYHPANHTLLMASMHTAKSQKQAYSKAP